MGVQAEILKRRYEDLRANGLLDMKISFAPLEGETVESVCASINEVLDAIERGEYSDSPPIGDSRRKTAT